MDPDRYLLRPFLPPDYAAETRLWMEVEPTWAVPPEEIERRERAFFPPPLVLAKFAIEDRSAGCTVALGRLANDPDSFDPHTFWVNVLVERAHQHQGLGLALAGAIRREARRLGATRLWAMVFADNPRSVDFSARQGMVERRRSWRSQLLVGSSGSVPDRTAVLEREGVEFLTAADLDLSDTAVAQALADLNTETSSDEPRLGPYTPISVAQFVAIELSGPAFLPEAFLLARVQGTFVGLCVLRRSLSEPDTLAQSFTGTARAFRGRGIATELKRRALEYARAHGYTRIVTGNDSLNRPMLAINRKFGFQVERERIEAELLELA